LTTMYCSGPPSASSSNRFMGGSLLLGRASTGARRPDGCGSAVAAPAEVECAVRTHRAIRRSGQRTGVPRRDAHEATELLFP
jgi:hypothetical protein